MGEEQDRLVAAGVLDAGGMIFLCDHVFDNWTVATRVISGKAQYAGPYYWQLLQEPTD